MTKIYKSCDDYNMPRMTGKQDVSFTQEIAHCHFVRFSSIPEIGTSFDIRVSSCGTDIRSGKPDKTDEYENN